MKVEEIVKSLEELSKGEEFVTYIAAISCYLAKIICMNVKNLENSNMEAMKFMNIFSDITLKKYKQLMDKLDEIEDS